MKKLLSFLLVFVLVLSMAAPTLAVVPGEDTYTGEDTFESDGLTVKIIEDNSGTSSTNTTQTGNSFSVEQYVDGKLVQIVYANYNSDLMRVVDYENEVVVDTCTIRVSDRVSVKHESTTAPEAELNYTPSTSIGSLIGRITYKTNTYSGEVETIGVYGYRSGYKLGTIYTVDAHVGDTVAVLAAAIKLALAFTIPLPYQKWALALAKAAGNYAEDKIRKAFETDIVTDMYEYKMSGYDPDLDNYSTKYTGKAYRVVDDSYNLFDAWYYDKYTPRNWKDSSFAYWLWCDLFDPSQYPGVNSYT